MSNFAAIMNEHDWIGSDAIEKDCGDSSCADEGGKAAVIGFFDGVHRGHQHLVGTLLGESKKRGLKPIAVTFSKQPRQVLQPEWRPQLLTTAEERVRLLKEAGVKDVVMLDFTREISQLTAREFMQQVLRDLLGVRLLVVGYDTRFGHDRRETVGDYCRYGREMGMEVVQATCLEGCSSSAIRRLIQEGRVDEAAGLLGRFYTLGGTVVHGMGNGQKMGFPTVNMEPDSAEKIVPAAGVYATQARVDEEPWTASMTDIGVRPTFGGERMTVETHLLNVQRDLYGRHVEVMFCQWMRAERAFPTPEALREQLRKDAEEARGFRMKKLFN